MSDTRGRLVIPENLESLIVVNDNEFGRTHIFKDSRLKRFYRYFFNDPVFIFDRPPEDHFLESIHHLPTKFPHAIDLTNQGKTGFRILRTLKHNEKIIVSDLPTHPDVLEIAIVEDVGEKTPGMAETGYEVKTIEKGYVFKKDIHEENVSYFVPYNKDIFPKANKDFLEDIKQYKFGDCFLLASILGILQNENDGPNFIRSMMRQVGNDVIVRLYDPRTNQPVYIKVENSELYENGKTAVKHRAPWVHIIEKAYAALAIKAELKGDVVTFKKGIISFQDIYGGGGFSHLALNVLTGIPYEKPRAFETPNLPLPWDKSSLDTAIVVNDFAEIIKIFKEMGEKEGRKYEFELEDILVALVKDNNAYGKTKNFIADAVDSGVLKISDIEHPSFKNLFDLLKKLENHAKEKNLKLSDLLKQVLNFIYYLSSRQMNNQKDTISTYLPFSLISDFGGYLINLKNNNKDKYTQLINKFNEPCLTPQKAREIVDSLNTDHADMPYPIREALRLSIQRISYDDSIKFISTPDDYPWDLGSFNYCYEMYQKIHVVIDKLNPQQLFELDLLMDSKDFINLLTTVQDTPMNRETLVQSLHVKGILSPNIKFLMDKLFHEAKDEEVFKALIEYANYHSYLKKLSEISPNLNVYNILKITQQVGLLGRVGKFYNQVKLDKQEEELSLLGVGRKPINSNASYDTLYKLEWYRTSTNDQFPPELFPKFKTHIKVLFPNLLRVDELRGSGLYTENSLDIYHEIKQATSGPNKLALTASTKEKIPDVGLYTSHAYAVLGAVEKDGIKYITVTNPWGHSGRGYKREANGELKPQFIKEGTFDIELSDFTKYFKWYTKTEFPKPILDKDSDQDPVIPVKPAPMSKPILPWYRRALNYVTNLLISTPETKKPSPPDKKPEPIKKPAPPVPKQVPSKPKESTAEELLKRMIEVLKLIIAEMTKLATIIDKLIALDIPKNYVKNKNIFLPPAPKKPIQPAPVVIEPIEPPRSR